MTQLSERIAAILTSHSLDLVEVQGAYGDYRMADEDAATIADEIAALFGQ